MTDSRKIVPSGFSYEFETDKYIYCYMRDDEGDVVKTYHRAINKETKEMISIPVSPYGCVTRDLFETWIDVGMPSYEEIGRNLNSRILLGYPECESDIKMLRERFFYKQLEKAAE